MRKLSLLLLLFISVAAFGQNQKSGTVTGSQCVVINTSNRATVGIQVKGSWSGTIQPNVQTLLNGVGQGFQPVQVTPTSSTTAQATITGNNTYWAVVAGFDQFEVCGATVSSTATVIMNAVTMLAMNVLGGGGGGGGGTVTVAGAGNLLACYPTIGAGTTVIQTSKVSCHTSGQSGATLDVRIHNAALAAVANGNYWVTVDEPGVQSLATQPLAGTSFVGVVDVDPGTQLNCTMAASLPCFPVMEKVKINFFVLSQGATANGFTAGGSFLKLTNTGQIGFCLGSSDGQHCPSPGDPQVQSSRVENATVHGNNLANVIAYQNYNGGEGSGFFNVSAVAVANGVACVDIGGGAGGAFNSTLQTINCANSQNVATASAATYVGVRVNPGATGFGPRLIKDMTISNGCWIGGSCTGGANAEPNYDVQLVGFGGELKDSHFETYAAAAIEVGQVYVAGVLTPITSGGWLISSNDGNAAHDVVQISNAGTVKGITTLSTKCDVTSGNIINDQNHTPVACSASFQQETLYATGANSEVLFDTSGTNAWDILGSLLFPSLTANAVPYLGAAGTLGLSQIAAPATKGLYYMGWAPTTSATTNPASFQVGIPTRAISGASTTDTTLYTDAGWIVDHDIAGSQSVVETIPTPTTLNNTNFGFKYTNHSTHTDTIKATTWTIQEGNSAAVPGATGISVAQGISCVMSIDNFNATQWLADCFPNNGAGGTGTVTSIATTSPITGGTITTTGTIACATCVTSAAPLTSTAIMTGGGSQASQTASATSTMDSSGNVVLAGTLKVNGECGSGTAGCLMLPQGSAQGHATANNVVIEAPAAVTAFEDIWPGTSATGFLYGTNSSAVRTESFGELSGDVTTSGSLATTVVKVNGVTQFAPAMTTSAMGAQSSATCTNITSMTWNIAANKNYILKCEIPMTLAATATIQYCLGGPGTATSYSLIADGDLGTAGVWSQISTLAQTAYGTKTNASAAVAANTVQHVWAGIQNGATASGTALTLQTAANGTNNITVGANATCQLTQIN